MSLSWILLLGLLTVTLARNSNFKGILVLPDSNRFHINMNSVSLDDEVQLTKIVDPCGGNSDDFVRNISTEMILENCQEGVSVLTTFVLGPLCSSTVQILDNINKDFSKWMVFTPGPAEPDFEAVISPRVFRIHHNFAAMADALISALRSLGWKKLVLFTDIQNDTEVTTYSDSKLLDNDSCYRIKTVLELKMTEADIELQSRMFRYVHQVERDLKFFGNKIIKDDEDFKWQGYSLFAICTTAAKLQHIMNMAHRLNFTGHPFIEDYMFLHLDVYHEFSTNSKFHQMYRDSHLNNRMISISMHPETGSVQNAVENSMKKALLLAKSISSENEIGSQKKESLKKWMIKSEEVHIDYLFDDDDFFDDESSLSSTSSTSSSQIKVTITGNDNLNQNNDFPDEYSLDSFSTGSWRTSVCSYRGEIRFKKNIVLREDMRKKLDRIDYLTKATKMIYLNHDFLAKFIGANVEIGQSYVMWENVPNTDLFKMLATAKFNHKWSVKIDFMLSICKGMSYLHSQFGAHGNLTTKNCLVDKRYQIKITDFGMYLFQKPKDDNFGTDKEEDDYKLNLLYKAPQFLTMKKEGRRNEDTLFYNTKPSGSKAGDMYSFGIIAHEIIYQQGPFRLDDYKPQEKIRNQIRIFLEEIVSRNTYRRPRLDVAHPFLGPMREDLIKMFELIWHPNPKRRYTFTKVQEEINALNLTNKDDLLYFEISKELEMEIKGLQEQADRIKQEIRRETVDTVNKLYEMMPKKVANTILKGETYTPESFDCITVSFTAIVGFKYWVNDIVSPYTIIDTLHNIFKKLDLICKKFPKIYKVETVGEMYMACAGCVNVDPGDSISDHAVQVARLGLAFAAWKGQMIQTTDGVRRALGLRTGVNSGPVTTAVIGLKGSRYTLLGAAVNQAARLQKSGKIKEVHTSIDTKELLDSHGSFIIEKRPDEVYMKGIGYQTTYFIKGEKDGEEESDGKVDKTDSTEKQK